MKSFKQQLLEIAITKLSEPEPNDENYHGYHMNRIQNAINSVFDSPYIHTDKVTNRRYKFHKLSHAVMAHAHSIGSLFHFHHNDDDDKETANRIYDSVEDHYEPFIGDVNNHIGRTIRANIKKDANLQNSIKIISKNIRQHPGDIIEHLISSRQNQFSNTAFDNLNNFHDKNFSNSSERNQYHKNLHNLAHEEHGSPFSMIYQGGINPRIKPQELL